MEKANILVVDDSFSNLLLIKDILSSNDDYQVFTENNGENVINQLNSNKIDLILLDIMMPRIDGYEVCKRVKQDAGFKDIPIVFLTAKIDEPSLLKGFELGGVDYIKKPFLISELMARVKTHINLKRTNERLKNELFKHSLTQQSLIASQNELSIRNKIAQYFLSDQGDEVYQKLLEEILKYVTMDYGVIGYMENANSEIIDISTQRLICPSIYSGEVETDRNYVFSMDEIGDVAVAAIRKQAIMQKSNVSKLFFTNAEVSCMIAVPIIYRDIVIGLIACAARENEHAENSRQKLMSLVNFIAPIIHQRIANQAYTQQLINSITDTQEQERKRFGKDIHDGLGSYLTTLTTYTSLISSGLMSKEECDEIIANMKDIIHETAIEARNIAYNLVPNMLGKFGLIDSIKYQYNRLFSTNKQTSLNFEHDDYTSNCDNEIEVAIFRITIELMNNAFKYAQASSIDIMLSSKDGGLKMCYKDNGVGFDIPKVMERIKDKKVSGLRNIRERVESLSGKFNIESRPGYGLKIDINLPHRNQE